MACDVCSGMLGSVPLGEIPDGEIAPEISTAYGGVSLRIYPFGEFGPFLELDGMWADGHTAFFMDVPIRYCPSCGRDLYEEHSENTEK